MLVGQVFQLLTVVCFVLVLLHAFQRSVGTGMMVLLIPIVCIVYGFTQFEHRHKGLILAGWLGGFVVAVVLRSVALVRAAT
jgi:benzodiazapine receptor